MLRRLLNPAKWIRCCDRSVGEAVGGCCGPGTILEEAYVWTLLHSPSNYERGACLSGRSIFELGSRPLQDMRGNFLRRVEMSDFMGLVAVVLVRSVSDSIKLSILGLLILRGF